MDFIDECPKGRAFKLSTENEEFWDLFQKVMPGLVSQGGQFHLEAIKTVFDIYGLPIYKQIYWFEKSLILMSIIMEARKEKHG